MQISRLGQSVGVGGGGVKIELKVPRENVGMHIVICDDCASTSRNAPMPNTYSSLVNGMHDFPP